ncbi:unnamed protein product [Protopolystoma xenopodis]|uniref:Uncharacterized protein n=1 Tax=Protopolystoma xenopodis TaxID=117903 RepID=A0A448X3T7_9PLAT|nr:unnamed protein product [Protopolystoma xenopodis]
MAGHFFPGIQEARVTKHTELASVQRTLAWQLERIEESNKVLQNPSFGLVIDGQSLAFALQVRPWNIPIAFILASY